jgi:hypothetical protein
MIFLAADTLWQACDVLGEAVDRTEEVLLVALLEIGREDDGLLGVSSCGRDVDGRDSTATVFLAVVQP